jgi:L,D-transpeptidase catalytic domain
MGRKDADENSLTTQALDDLARALNETNRLLRMLAGRAVLGAGNEIESMALPGAVRNAATTSGRLDVRLLERDILEDAALDEGVLRNLAALHGLQEPAERLIAHRNEKRPQSRPRYWAVVNFNLHSRNPRLFVFDVLSGVVRSYLCAHGIGSEGGGDDGMADVFSNEDGSKASSLGIYLCAETYFGDNGYSLRMDGKEPTNFNARHRAIVIHGASYVSEEVVGSSGRVGRSWGCPAVDVRHAQDVIDALKEGSLLNIWKS